MFEILAHELVRVNTLLRNNEIDDLILGGGMGLYLRDECLEGFGPRSPRYPERPRSRSTKDLDLVITADIIADADKMETIRAVVREELDYLVACENFQFERDLEWNGREVAVGIDLLTAPPSSADTEDVKIGDF